MHELPPSFENPAIDEGKIGPWLMLAFGLLGAGLLIVTAVGIWRRSQATGDWIRTTGRIVGYEEVGTIRSAGERPGEATRPGRVEQRSSFPIIEYSDPSGAVHRFTSRLGAIDGTAVEVAIQYRGSNPAEAEVAHGFAQGGWMYVTGGLGLILLALGWFVRDKI